MRGAVICNVDYHPRGYSDELAFDWYVSRLSVLGLALTLGLIGLRTKMPRKHSSPHSKKLLYAMTQRQPS
jgi:hypothetical protein